MNKTLKFCFFGADGIMAIYETLTAGMVGKKVCFEFSDDWDGLTKTAVYMAGDVTRTESCTEGENEIPADVLAIPGNKLYVGIFGESSDGQLVIPTILAKGPVIQPGADPMKAPVGDHPVSAYDRLQAQIDEMKKRILAFEEADAGQLLYISADGTVQPVALGKGLKIVDGVLTLNISTGGGETAAVSAEIDADGILRVYDSGGAEVVPVVDEAGVISWPGITTSLNDNGILTFAEEE